jgi:hypothetical protein
MKNDKSKFKNLLKKEKQRITRIARIKAKKDYSFYKQKMTIVNSFVIFVLFVVEKWGVGIRKRTKISVVKNIQGEFLWSLWVGLS